MSGTPASITIQRRIEWSDTDASGHYHNTAAFRMLEWAETALFESLGFLDDVYGRLPRVHISADFKQPLDHRDLVDIELEVVDVGKSSLAYEVRIRRAGTVCVEARFVTSLVGVDGRPQPWPGPYRELLLSAGPQPAERLVTDGLG